MLPVAERYGDVSVGPAAAFDFPLEEGLSNCEVADAIRAWRRPSGSGGSHSMHFCNLLRTFPGN